MHRLASRMRGQLPFPKPSIASGPNVLAKQFAFVVGFIVIAAVLYDIFINLRHNFVLNLSSSVAPGLYQRVGQPIEVGALVLFAPDAATLSWHRELTGVEGVETFLKPVHQLGPFTICREATALRLNDVALPVSSLDPRFIEDGECADYDAQNVFALSIRIPNSFDSRHHGPVSLDTVDDIYAPAFTWD